MEWEYSPSSKTIPFPDPADAAGGSTSHGNVNPGPPKGLRGKEPANVVAGKRVSKPTIKVSASANQRLSPRTWCFKKNQFEGKKGPYSICDNVLIRLTSQLVKGNQRRAQKKVF
jgi:hypothetical protein